MIHTLSFFFFLRLCFVVLFFQTLSAQGDSLVTFSKLGFNSEGTKTTFASHRSLTKRSDYLYYFLENVNGEYTKDLNQIEHRLSEHLFALKNKVEGLTEMKKIKIVYESLHREFLAKYELRTSFSDIFDKAIYNCVSASALYALCFDELGIPYEIKETPNHVFLVTYPNTYRIVIETTNPLKGYYELNKKNSEAYVRYLVNSKIVSKAEFDTSSVQKLVDRYYFSAKAIELKALVGVQYYNYAIYNVDDKNYERASECIKRACFFEADEKSKTNLKFIMGGSVQDGNYSKQTQVDNLVLLARMHDMDHREVSAEYLLNQFNRILENQLIKSSDYKNCEVSYNKLKAEIKDTALINDISFNYHYELARLGYLSSKDKEYEMEHLQKAYAIHPGHADLQAIILAYLSNTLKENSDTKQTLLTLEEYRGSFDFLNSHKQFGSLYASTLLERAYENYMVSTLASGDKCLREFELYCEKQKAVEPYSASVEKAYATAAGIYYKRGNTARSRELLKTGLKYAPENFGLMRRLQQIK